MEYNNMLETVKAFKESIKRPLKVFKPCQICGREATLGKIEDKKVTSFLCDVHRGDLASKKRHISAWRRRLKRKHGITLLSRDPDAQKLLGLTLFFSICHYGFLFVEAVI